jgi:C1A family cysteine protease
MRYDAEFLYASVLPDIERIQHSGGHAMEVVGSNDDWRYNNRFAVPASIAALRGAFVLHNSWDPMVTPWTL